MTVAKNQRAGPRRRPAPDTAVLLLDNGSLRPAATRRLRKIAAALSRRIGRRVAPVSLLHADKIPAADLGGRRAEILQPAVVARLERGVRGFVIVPLFIGRSRALTEFIPGLAREWRRRAPRLRVRLAPPLARPGDDGLARIIEGEVRRLLTINFLRGAAPRVALVDHGSAVPAVNRARDRVAAQLRRRLGARVAGVAACSMELPGRGATDAAPLLATLLASAPWNAGPVVVAQLFLLPGRHAGPGGDIAGICARAQAASPGLRVRRTRLLGDATDLVRILAARYRLAKRRA